MRHTLIVTLMVMTCFAQNLAEAANADERESLRGLPGVHVLIENITKDAQADGLLVDSVRNAVELILRSGGIKILTESEILQTTPAAYLYVKIGAYKNKSGLYGVSVRVSLEQRVSLLGAPQQIMFAPTWQDEVTGTIGSSNIAKVINHVESTVKSFANDFLTVNPR